MKLMLIGSPGSGKSTLARQIQRATGWPLMNLDYYWHQTDYSMVAKKHFDFQQNEFMLTHPHHWIIDGNYRATMGTRMRHADVIVWLQVPRAVAVQRVLARSYQTRVQHEQRADMAPDFSEHLDREYWDFIKFVWGFPQRNRQAIPELAHRYAPQTPLLLVSQRDKAALLAKIQAGTLLDFPDRI
ncbi:P-loop NTPase family protein [Lapidilactobacillus salsurivasis]